MRHVSGASGTEGVARACRRRGRGVALWGLARRVNQVGLVVDAPITLITSDRENLSCALYDVVGRLRCRFRAPGRPWPDSVPPTDLLAPYVTLDHHMYLVPGLFEQPAILARYAPESPKDRSPGPPPSVRGALQTPIGEEGRGVSGALVGALEFPGRRMGTWVAEPISCTVE